MIVFSRFAMVGSVGFIVDASVFYCLTEFDVFGINLARIFAFILAMLTTWLGNRFFTFQSRGKNKALIQLTKHCSSACLSFFINFAIFQLLLFLGCNLALAFVSGILIGMLSNYFLAKHFVFSTHQLTTLTPGAKLATTPATIPATIPAAIPAATPTQMPKPDECAVTLP